MLKFLQLISGVTLLVGGIFFWNFSQFQNQKMCVDFVDGYLEIEKGETFRTALRKIYDNELFIKLYLKNNLPNFELQAGKYEIACGDISQILESFRTPLNDTDIALTFLEGWNIFDIDQYLAGEGFINSGDFSNYAKDYEGFLYPDTYAINPNNFSIEGLVEKMRNNFNKKTADIIPSSYSEKQIHELLTLASIVQKEANKADNPEEIAIIAGILKKRLDEGWMIGADATVCYAHSVSTQDCSPTKVLEYLYDENPYNTRVIAGLPARPIANPEDVIIKATINSETSPYYYYLHDNSGQIHYGRTNAEHIRNKNTYLR